ncbi:MAG TPA: cytochrome c [Thermoleophilaceae bacterium]|nr:cytochrome c [Thermoleophilaceae bacterium]
MEAAAFLLAFVVLGGLVLFVAFSGGPSEAREAYLTRGNRLFRVSIVVLYIAFGLAVPALVLANKEEDTGGVGALRSTDMTASEARGKDLFLQMCASCHSLAAVNARGVTGPSLDQIGEVSPERVVNAIENGGTGQGLMPANLLEGEEARDVAEYVSKVAGSN